MLDQLQCRHSWREAVVRLARFSAGREVPVRLQRKMLAKIDRMPGGRLAQATRGLTDAVSSATPFFASAKNIEVLGLVYSSSSMRPYPWPIDRFAAMTDFA